MLKNLIVTMDYVTWYKWQLVATAVGAGIGWAMCNWWRDAFNEARDAGAVASN